ncbi:MAG: family 20 glycosylhydrolase [Chloroflexi bacterium]|nr:family 20 glycosylhydrolase [Chloroflexota bacterium]
MTNPILLPTPRHLEFQTGTYTLKPGKRIALMGAPVQELFFSGERLRRALHDHANVDWTLAATATGASDEIGATLRVDENVRRTSILSEAHERAVEGQVRRTSDEAYELAITPNAIEIVATSPRGIFYGVCTLIQLLQQTNKPTNQLPNLNIIDSPDFPHRGVMLDISRDKVPTMQTLFDLVDLLASWKVNQLQLYTEHTFAYRNHREVWENASPMTEQEILELDRFCRERFIELVPNQNSFGHMSRWFKHKRYLDLAETPDGCIAWGERRPPMSLNPGDPRSLQFVGELFDELLPNFSSTQFNAGCDETMDLGQGRSKEECERRGSGRVYLDFVLKIYDEVRKRGHTMQFWGDIIVQHPELIPELPKDAIALEWGYEADHPFDEDGAHFAAAGIPFYVCPGTSSWNTVVGRTDNAIGNLQSAAENGLKHGAIGYLNTDWGDNGHWQYLPFSYLGFGYGAALSWCLESNRDMNIARALSLYAFRDATGTLGRIAFDLGNTHKELGLELHNSTALFRILQKPLKQMPEEFYGLTPDAIKRTQRAIDRAMRPINKAKSTRADAKLIHDELASAAAILHHACQRALLAFEKKPAKARARKRELAHDLPRLIKEYHRLWHARNRPGGFKESVARFEKLRKDYE